MGEHLTAIRLIMSAPPAKLRAVFMALRQHNGVLSEHDAARLVGMSESRFRHLFTERIGFPFQFVRLAVRLLYGAELLRNTNLPIAQIADLLKYSERSSFEKCFKKMFAMTPAESRRGNRHKETHSQLDHRQSANVGVRSTPFF